MDRQISDELQASEARNACLEAELAQRNGDFVTEGEAKYRSLFEAMDDGFCVIELCDGPHGSMSDYVYVEANPAYERNAGTARVVGRKVRELLPDEADDWVELFGQVLRTGEPVRFERGSEATGKYLEVSAFRLEPAIKNQVAVLCKDVTARREGEIELRTLSERLDALIRASSEVRYLISADWSELHELAGGGFIADTNAPNTDWVEGYIPAEDQPALRAEIARAIAAKDTYDIEHRVNQADGSVGWAYSRAVPLFDADGQITEWLGAASDITARRRAEIALQELAETLEQQVEARTRERDQVWSMPSLLLAVARFDSTIVAVNPGWPALLGWEEEELLGRCYAEFIHPDDAERSLDWARRLAAGEEVEELVNLYRRKDGSYRSIAWTIARGHEVFHCVGRDVTVEMDQAATIVAAEEQLRQAQKMEAVGQLTGGLAHDFNNLLMGMMGNLEILQMRIARGRIDDLNRFVVAAQGAGKRAASLTQRLLAFSRRQTLDPKPTNVNRLIAGMDELLRRTMGPQVAIEIIAEADPWTGNIDAGQMENALLNLCINARDAMPFGGRLTIETANESLDDSTATERGLDPGEYLSVRVTDTGTGMTAETLERAFEPFFTTKPIGQGTGLGLSMIYGFARQSGGQVRIHSKLGHGTTFCIFFPRHAGDAEAAIVDTKLRETAAATGQTVLVVDDEPAIRELIDEVLNELGYTVIGAADGAAGLKVLQTGAKIDLLVTDVGLPNGLNGRQVADAARHLRPGLKVLFITGYAENAAVGNGQLEPGMDLLTKPFSLEALVAKIADVMKA